ncbi:hypothetical protein [Nitrosospira multiformis]|uniref:hypothetical protein n=1 Tax=Nitrosospira multiformis TaxID=1231 RepID=UPI00089942F8|nr:hypothetical protein [Nitrosospira multiformis]SEA58265.1 hypothetical protein SAMN05216411_11360 [Nitrosospira multiformis]
MEEIAPGYCWQDNAHLALASIRKLKALESSEKCELWPNHDMNFFMSLPRFPAWSAWKRRWVGRGKRIPDIFTAPSAYFEE